jgi:hypothetical protein
LLTGLWNPMRWGLQIVYWRRPRHSFTATQGGASSQHMLPVAHIHDSEVPSNDLEPVTWLCSFS